MGERQKVKPIDRKRVRMSATWLLCLPVGVCLVLANAIPKRTHESEFGSVVSRHKVMHVYGWPFDALIALNTTETRAPLIITKRSTTTSYFSQDWMPFGVVLNIVIILADMFALYLLAKSMPSTYSLAVMFSAIAVGSLPILICSSYDLTRSTSFSQSFRIVLMSSLLPLPLYLYFQVRCAMMSRFPIRRLRHFDKH